jgi:hypothetical protein
MRPDPEKVSAILEMKAPTNVGEVRRFLGLVSQQSKYIEELAEKQNPSECSCSKSPSGLGEHNSNQHLKR